MTAAGTDAAELIRRVAAVPVWHHRLELAPGVVTPGAYDPRDLWQRLALGDLHGRRVLDVGARDGFFSFACEQAGAQVVAVDHVAATATGFALASEVLGSRVEYVQANVYELSPQSLGTFDVVLFLGVLYHLRHPLLALDALRGLCRERIYVESLVCDETFFLSPGESRPLREIAPALVDLPLAQFLPIGLLHRDWTNKWSPNVAGLRALVEDAQFSVGDVSRWGDRALIAARTNSDAALARRTALDRGIVP